MTESAASSASTRADRRKAQTRAALIRAGQQFIAQDRTSAAILEITQVADVGMGSFYNHFASKEELFQAAVDEALEAHGSLLDDRTRDLTDPAETFACSFRITGRLHRLRPQLSRVLLSRGPAILNADIGLAPRALRDIELAQQSGRFTIADARAALVIAGGTALALGQFIHDHPDVDDAQFTDQVTEDLIHTFGVSGNEAAAICHQSLPDINEFITGTS